MRKIIFIDRDGVINVDPIGDYIKRWEDFKFEKGALEALRQISGAGYEIILISNQAGVGDGIFQESAFQNIHENMMRVLTENKIRILSSHFCLHGKNAGCKCRKPEIGLFLEATKNLEFNKQNTYFIGDKATDIEAGKRFGLKTIFVLTGHGKNDQSQLKGKLIPDHMADSLQDALRFLIP